MNTHVPEKNDLLSSLTYFIYGIKQVENIGQSKNLWEFQAKIVLETQIQKRKD